LQTFDISHTFLPLTIAKLSTFKNGPVFLAHPVYWTRAKMAQKYIIFRICTWRIEVYIIAALLVNSAFLSLFVLT